MSGSESASSSTEKQNINMIVFALNFFEFALVCGPAVDDFLVLRFSVHRISKITYLKIPKYLAADPPLYEYCNATSYIPKIIQHVFKIYDMQRKDVFRALLGVSAVPSVHHLYVPSIASERNIAS